MPIVVPGKDYTKSWNALADVFGNYAQTRDNAYQRQRQEAADARAVTSAQSVERNRQQLYDQRAAQIAEYEAALARDAAEREGIAANRLSPRDFARESTIAFADKPIPTSPSDFGQYPGEQGREPSPTMFGYKGPTEYNRYLSKAKLMRGMTTDEALIWKRFEDAASTIAKREQDTTAAFRQGQLDEITFNKLSVQFNREKQALDQARKEAEYEINKKREDAKLAGFKADRAGLEQAWRGDFEATVPAPQMVDAMVVPQQDWPKYKRFDPVLRPERAKEHIGIGLPQGFINEKEKEEYLKHYGLADTVTGQIGWPELDKKIKASGYSRVQLGEELAKHMKNVAGSSDDFTVDEQAVSSEAVLEALLQLQNINPQKDWLSEYRQIKSDKTNFIRETGSRSLSTLGFRDINWDPLTSEEIALTMLLRESKKRNDPQYESDKKRFKEKFGWLPKWA